MMKVARVHSDVIIAGMGSVHRLCSANWFASPSPFGIATVGGKRPLGLALRDRILGHARRGCNPTRTAWLYRQGCLARWPHYEDDHCVDCINAMVVA